MDAMSEALMTGLQHYYKFDSGTIDSVGSSNGVNYGAILRTTGGMSGGAYDFDGSNDYVSLGTGEIKSIFDENQNFSISFWMYQEGSPESNGRQIVLNKSYYSHTSPYYQFYVTIYPLTNTTPSIRATLYSPSLSALTTSYSYVANNVTFLNNWVHVAIVRDWSTPTFQIFINGEGGSINISTLPTYSNYDTQFDIGSANGLRTYRYAFDGKVDEVGIWSRKLSDDEITELYNKGAGLTYEPISYKLGMYPSNKSKFIPTIINT